MIETRREMAIRHVVSGRRIIAGQKLMISALLAQGRDARSAEDLLDRFEQSQAIFEQDLANLEAKK